MPTQPVPSLALAALLPALAWAADAQPSPSPSPSPAAAPSPAPSASPAIPASKLRSDIDAAAERAGEKVLAETPHFEEAILVPGQTPQEALDRFFADVDLQRGATPGGAPSAEEMNRYRPGVSPGLNLLGLLQWLIQQTTARVGEPRYYLYEVTTPYGTWPLLREVPLREEAAGQVPGVGLRLVRSYRDWAGARRGYRELQEVVRNPAVGPPAPRALPSPSPTPP